MYVRPVCELVLAPRPHLGSVHAVVVAVHQAVHPIPVVRAVDHGHPGALGVRDEEVVYDCVHIYLFFTWLRSIWRS